MARWRQVYASNTKNSALAASASETIASSKADRDRYGPFNSLIVQNLDASCDIEIRLDGRTTEGSVLFAQRGGGIAAIEPDEGVEFSFFLQVNLSTTTAQTVSSMNFRWGKSVPVGDGVA